MAEPREFQFSNFGLSTLAGGIAGSSLSMTVQMNDGMKFPNADATYDEIFTCILSTPGLFAVEIVYVTEVNGDVFTIERGKENTTARNWEAGTTVVHSITAQMFNDIVAGGPTPAAENAAMMCGEDGALTYTTDGINFQRIGFFSNQQVSPLSADWRALARDPTANRIVTVGPSTHVGYSDDGGFTWALVRDALNTGGPGGAWSEVIWSPTFSKFIACGGGDKDECVADSPDGITWTHRATTFVAAGQGNTINGLIDAPAPFSKPGLYGVHDNDYAYSADGETWVNIDANLGNGWAGNGRTARMAFNGTAMIGGAVEGSNANPGVIGFSTDGINFVQNDADQGGNADTTVEWAPGLGIFISTTSGSLVDQGSTSVDGETWVGIPVAAFPARAWTRPFWSESFQLAYALSATFNNPPQQLMRSADAAVWTDTDPDGTGESFGFGRQWWGGLDVAQPTTRNKQEVLMVEQGTSPKQIAVSEDGHTYFQVAAENTANADQSIAFSPTLGTQGRFCTVGSAGAIATSDDAGTTWTDRTPAAVVNFAHVMWSPTHSLFIAGAVTVANTTNIHTSPDGITWTERTTSQNFECNYISDDGSGNLIAVGNVSGSDRSVYFSSNGTTWTQCTDDVSITESTCSVYDATRNRFIVGGVQEEFRVSTDGGDTWTDLGATVAPGHQTTLASELVVTASGRLVMGTNAGVQQSNDGGVTWTESFDTTQTGLVIRFDGRILGTSQGSGPGVIWSDDDGVSFNIGAAVIGTQASWRRMAVGRVLETFSP
ncbi:MAG: exo-alpha-sialidase [Anaerolineales bacterium]|nr:exo-alpha-sialidase [Anaerolineales bacterium]